MGLDQFVYAIKETPDTKVDYKIKTLGDPDLIERPTEVFYWRKHPEIHGWMESLYNSKGGTSDFNCTTVQLELDDINCLHDDIMNRKLPRTQGFFFGDPVYRTKEELDKMSKGDRKDAIEEMTNQLKEDLIFIEKAKEFIANGYYLFYDSWW